MLKWFGTDPRFDAEDNVQYLDDTFFCRVLEAPSDRQSAEIITLYRSQGWWKAYEDDRSDLLTRLITGSHLFVIAEEAGKVVGIGRVISDGVSDAYIQDVTVSSTHRRRGIGRIILQTILKQLADDGIPWIGLIAEPGSAALYESLGFSIMPGAVPMVMVREQ